MGGRTFDTTQWSVVVAAGSDQTTLSRNALAQLCETYWFPLYAYVQRRGYPREEAQDLTQEFFTRLIEKNALKKAKRDLGRFRSFLLTSMNNFLADQWDKAKAQKRGGGMSPISLDFVSAEGHPVFEPAHNITPEKLYERQWALTVLDTVLNRLSEEYTESGKQDLFQGLKPVLTSGKGVVSYQDLAVKLGISEGAIKVAAHRLRKKYRVKLKGVIAQTVANKEDIEDEIQHLFAALAS